MVREGYEDYQRYKSDNQVNNSNVDIVDISYTSFKFKSCKKWMDLHVGEIVVIKKNEEIPADLIVLSSSDENGEAFIQTSSLDGEKNLKQKFSLTCTQSLFNPFQKLDIEELKEYQFMAQAPDQFINNFEGSLTKKDRKYIIQSTNFVMKGAYLKNTAWIVCVIVYTGNDTKLMRNQEPYKIKQSEITKKTNTLTAFIFLFQVICCVLLTLLGYSFLNKNNDIKYIFQQRSTSQQTFINFFSIFILIQTFIPISLLVSLEVVKVFQAYFLIKDEDMVGNKIPLKVSTFSINEQLGQVEMIFSDKTGTLTCNQMVFKNCVIGNKVYHLKEDEKINLELQAEIKGLNIKEITGEQQQIYDFMLMMASCHECIIDKDAQESSLVYQGMSPDEICLVTAANQLGFEFLGDFKKQSSIQINQQNCKIDILHKFQFDSDRKRMSVIIRDKGKILVFCKGADSIILERLDKKKQDCLNTVQSHLYQYSILGLRTLCFAYKQIDEETYKNFQNQCLSLADTQDREQQICINILYLVNLSDQFESDLILIGCTAIEDKLQENVPQTIQKLLKANIQLWMLTGDKLETAENIAKSCNMIKEDMLVHKLTNFDLVSNKSDLHSIKLNFGKTENKAIEKGIIIEGHSLKQIMQDDDLTQLFLQLILMCKSVICCRSTPKQKAEMVRLIRTKANKITLAIGDGANDCNMIQEANIGIGIFGNEGMRAVQVSDFAIGEFQLLAKLLLVHGRMSYIRIAEMINYFFYKNFVMTMIQVLFQFYSGQSGQTVWNDWFISFYNMIFTTFPVLTKAIYDQDIFLNYLKKIGFYYYVQKVEKMDYIFPYLYSVGQKNTIFNKKTFLINLVQAIGESILIFYLSLAIYTENYQFTNGYQKDIWSLSILMYTIVICVVQLKIAITIQQWNILQFLSFTFLSFFCYVYYLLVSSIFLDNLFYVSMQVLGNNNYYANVSAIVCFLFLIQLTIFVCKRDYNIDMQETIRRVLNTQKGLEYLQTKNNINNNLLNTQAIEMQNI